MTKPIVVEITKQTDRYPRGAELGFESVATAEKVLGDDTFKVLRYQDGSSLDSNDSPQDADPLMALTRDELEQRATELEVEGPLSRFKTKADLVAAMPATASSGS